MAMCVMIGAGTPTRTFLADDGQFLGASNATTFTFTSKPLGTPDASRLIIVPVFWGGNTNGNATMTIGGVSATEVVACRGFDLSSGYYSKVSLFQLAVPTGTTATVVVTTPAVNSCGIGMWAAYNLSSTTPVDATSCSSVGSATGVLDINVSSFGLGFGYAFVDPTTGATWTGLTEDFDRIPATYRYSGASLENGSTAGTPMTIHVTSVSNIVGASVSYR